MAILVFWDIQLYFALFCLYIEETRLYFGLTVILWEYLGLGGTGTKGFWFHFPGGKEKRYKFIFVI